MAKTHTRKIGLEMDVRLYQELSRLATENGQSRRFLLEKALEHYLRSWSRLKARYGLKS